MHVEKTKQSSKTQAMRKPCAEIDDRNNGQGKPRHESGPRKNRAKIEIYESKSMNFLPEARKLIKR